MAETIKLVDSKGGKANKSVTWPNNQNGRRLEVDNGTEILRYEHTGLDVDGTTRVFRLMDTSPKPK